MLRDDTVCDLFVESFGDEDPKFIDALRKAQKKATKACKKVSKIKQTCSHPSKHIKAERSGYYMGDGYGGEDWIDRGFSVCCKLCGADLGQVTFEQDKAVGDERFVKIYEKALEDSEKEWADYKRQCEEEREKQELERLKKKYE